MKNGNTLLDQAFAESAEKQSVLHEILFGKSDMPFNGEIEDDGFITVYVSPPLKQD